VTCAPAGQLYRHDGKRSCILPARTLIAPPPKFHCHENSTLLSKRNLLLQTCSCTRQPNASAPAVDHSLLAPLAPRPRPFSAHDKAVTEGRSLQDAQRAQRRVRTAGRQCRLVAISSGPSPWARQRLRLPPPSGRNTAWGEGPEFRASARDFLARFFSPNCQENDLGGTRHASSSGQGHARPLSSTAVADLWAGWQHLIGKDAKTVERVLRRVVY
jgi:hypothetical protein